MRRVRMPAGTLRRARREPVFRRDGPLPDRPVRPRTVIRLEDVHRTYRLGEIAVHALRGVSLEVQRATWWPSWAAREAARAP